MSSVHNVKSPIFISLLIIVFLAGCFGTLTEQTVSPPNNEEADASLVAAKITTPVIMSEVSPSQDTQIPQLALYGDGPILTADFVGELVTDMYLGDVVIDNGMFHMLFGVYADNEPAVYHATSDDGYYWEIVSDQPVSMPQGSEGVGGISVLAQNDNSWIMYRGTTDGGIGQAAAPQLDGPWTLSETTLVASDGPGAWDEHGLAWIDLVAYDGEYAMYFVGAGKWADSIGMAISADGRNWTKYDDPVTTDSRFAHSDPVIHDPSDTGKQVADYSLRAPAVRVTADGGQMIYIASPTPMKGGKDAFYLATSADGITWEPYPGNPIFEPDLDYNDILDATWVENAGTEFLYFTLLDNQGISIYLATTVTPSNE